MEFRTELFIKPYKQSIGIQDRGVTMGSCFADEIAERLAQNKFIVLKNPFGTVYNPVSIHNLLRDSINQTGPSSGHFLERDGLFYHYDFHSDWHAATPSLLNQNLTFQQAIGRDSLVSAQYLIITYGTAWVYENKETKSIVANCHKVPQQNFDKVLLTQKRIVESFETLHKLLKKVNPACRIILSVSPVRHIKDTLELNSVSKSILRLTCHALSESFADVEYFPAYEIMLDDLRDYRFYKPDMIHPSAQAVDYIWEKFGDAYFDAETKSFLLKWSKINMALQHKPFHPEGDSHQKFLKEILVRLSELRVYVDVGDEIEQVKNQIRPG
jgi:hypothetical protein